MTILSKSPSSIAAGPRSGACLMNMVVSPGRFCQPHSAAGLALAAIFSLAALPAKSGPQAPATASTDGFASPWSVATGGAGQMRLLAATPVADHAQAAVEIKLPPTALTYWREPGEAGVPPEFSFGGSENLATADVRFPAPQRYDEAGLEAFGYKGEVVFPIHVTPKDATHPVHLSVTLNYAICDQICIPAKGNAELTLPQSGASPQQAMIAAAEARVPVVLGAADVTQDVVLTQVPGGAKPQWQLVWRGKAQATDLFAEAPQGYAFATRKTGANAFSLVAVEVPAAIGASVPLRLTLTGPDKSYEFPLPLAFAASTH